MGTSITAEQHVEIFIASAFPAATIVAFGETLAADATTVPPVAVSAVGGWLTTVWEPLSEEDEETLLAGMLLVAEPLVRSAVPGSFRQLDVDFPAKAAKGIALLEDGFIPAFIAATRARAARFSFAATRLDFSRQVAAACQAELGKTAGALLGKFGRTVTADSAAGQRELLALVVLVVLLSLYDTSDLNKGS